MSLWRQLVDHALDEETQRNEQEQMEWIAREPSNPEPYYNLAQLRRMQWMEDDGLALLLEAVRLNPSHAMANVGLAEIYAVRKDYRAAWRHARAAAAAGESSAVDLLTRYGVAEEA